MTTMHETLLHGAEFSRRTVVVFRHAISETFAIPFRHLPRVFFHGLILACIIAGFWLLDALKDPVLSSTVGIEYQPIAKLLSVLVTLVVTCFYDFLTSWLSKPSLFHLVSAVFGIIMMVLSALLSNPASGLGDSTNKGPHHTIGWVAFFSIEVYGSLMVALFWSFTNSIMDLEHAKGAYGLIISIAQIGAILGSTCATQVQSIGIPLLFLMSAMSIFSVSLMIKLYFITYRDRPTMTDSPARGKRMRGSNSLGHSRSRSASWDDSVQTHTQAPLLSKTGGARATSGMEMVAPRAGILGLSNDQAAAVLNEHGMQRQNDDDDDDDDDEVEEGTQTHVSNPKNASRGGAAAAAGLVSKPGTLAVFTGFYDGLALILRHTYVMQLMGVTCLYEIVVTVLDYQFKVLSTDNLAASAASFGTEIDQVNSGARFANLLGHFGQLTNMLSFFVSFFGYSFLVRRVGVRSSLMIFPAVMFVAVLLTNLVPTLPVLFVSVSVIKALVFSLHDPVKELLYIPTSQSVKFKAKAWIDVFGSRLAKAGGGFITNLAAGDARRLSTIAEIPCLVVSVALLLLAYSIGTEFQRLVDAHIVIGAEDVVAPGLALLGQAKASALGPGLSSRSREEWGSRSGSYDYEQEKFAQGLPEISDADLGLGSEAGTWPQEEGQGQGRGQGKYEGTTFL